MRDKQIYKQYFVIFSSDMLVGDMLFLMQMHRVFIKDSERHRLRFIQFFYYRYTLDCSLISGIRIVINTILIISNFHPDIS